MIGCECGGFTARVKQAHGGAVLTFERCGSCGRCDYWVLTFAGGEKVKGVKARLAFRRLCDGCTT